MPIMLIKLAKVIQLLLSLIVINKFRTYPVICLQCRTVDGPSEIELKRVTRNCMRKFGENMTTTATMTAKDFNVLQHQQPYQEQQQPKQNILYRDNSDKRYYNQFNSAQHSNVYSHYYNNHYADYYDYDVNDNVNDNNNDNENENMDNRNDNHQPQHYNNHTYKAENNNNQQQQHQQHQQQQQRFQNQYQQKNNQQQYSNNKNTSNNHNNNNNNNPRRHSTTNRTNNSNNHFRNDLHNLFNNHNQKNYNNNDTNNNNNNNNSNNNNNNSNRNNISNNNSNERFCLVHCFFEQMQMLNERHYPDRRKVLYVLTQNIRDRELRNFYIDTIQECFRYVETQWQRNDKCAFSRNLINCMTEYARANCDDWNEFNITFS